MAQLYHVWQPDDEDVNEELPNPDVQAFEQVIRFGFQIVRMLKDDNGRIRDRVVEFQDERLWIPTEVLSTLDLFVMITDSLRQAGIHDHDIEEVLTFSEITSILNKKENSELRVIPIRLCVHKWERWEDEAEAEDIAVEAAMAETARKAVPATKESIQALCKVKLGDNIIPRVACERCAICLEELSVLHANAMDITSMPCSHLFHENCIVKWLNTSHLCPLCRFPMPTNANDQ